MSEPDYTETLSGPKGLKPKFDAALDHVQAMSDEEALALVVASKSYVDSLDSASQEHEEYVADDTNGKEIVVEAVKAVEALWACANGDKSKMTGFSPYSYMDQIANDEEYEPELKESKRETKLIVTSNPSIADDFLRIFMLSGAGEIAGFDDLDSMDLEESKELLEELKKTLGLCSPDI